MIYCSIFHGIIWTIHNLAINCTIKGKAKEAISIIILVFVRMNDIRYSNEYLSACQCNTIESCIIALKKLFIKIFIFNMYK